MKRTLIACSWVVILMLVCTIGISCRKKNSVEVKEGTPPVIGEVKPPADNETLPPPTFPETEIVPAFEILHTTNEERGDLNETLFVLIPPVDLSLNNYVVSIKNLVKKLVVYDKRSEHISILVFDDRDSLEKVFQDAQTTDLNVPVHYLARYDGNKEGLTYQFNLQMFPIAPGSNPVVVEMQEEIEFDPYNW